MASPQGIVFKDLGENSQTQRDKVIRMVDKLNCESNPLIQNGSIALFYDSLTCAFHYCLSRLARRIGHIFVFPITDTGGAILPFS